MLLALLDEEIAERRVIQKAAQRAIGLFHRENPDFRADVFAKIVASEAFPYDSEKRSELIAALLDTQEEEKSVAYNSEHGLQETGKNSGLVSLKVYRLFEM
jgi:hypothetical protein